MGGPNSRHSATTRPFRGRTRVQSTLYRTGISNRNTPCRPSGRSLRLPDGRSRIWRRFRYRVGASALFKHISSLGLLATLLLFGLSNGGLDVAINAQAVTVERTYSLRILSSFHALWSMGGLTGASLASFLAVHRLSYSQHLLWIGLGLAAGFLTMPSLLVTGDAERTSPQKLPLSLTRHQTPPLAGYRSLLWSGY